MSASQVKLSLDNLKDLEMGMPVEMFDMELRRVVRDLEERPMDDTTRCVNLSFKFKPIADSKGRSLDSVAVEFSTSSSIPKQKTKVYLMAAKADGSLVFNPERLDDPRSASLFQRPEQSPGANRAGDGSQE